MRKNYSDYVDKSELVVFISSLFLIAKKEKTRYNLIDEARERRCR